MLLSFFVPRDLLLRFVTTHFVQNILHTDVGVQGVCIKNAMVRTTKQHYIRRSDTLFALFE